MCGEPTRSWLTTPSKVYNCQSVCLVFSRHFLTCRLPISLPFPIFKSSEGPPSPALVSDPLREGVPCIAETLIAKIVGLSFASAAPCFIVSMRIGTVSFVEAVAWLTTVCILLCDPAPRLTRFCQCIADDHRHLIHLPATRVQNTQSVYQRGPQHWPCRRLRHRGIKILLCIRNCPSHLSISRLAGIPILAATPPGRDPVGLRPAVEPLMPRL